MSVKYAIPDASKFNIAGRSDGPADVIGLDIFNEASLSWPDLAGGTKRSSPIGRGVCADVNSTQLMDIVYCQTWGGTNGHQHCRLFFRPYLLPATSRLTSNLLSSYKIDEFPI